MTIDGGGGQVASVLVAGTNGIVVPAGANDTVTLRNLRVNGIGAGINGIRFLSGASLVVENCEIFGFTAAAINVAPSAGGRVFVSKSTLTNNLNGIFADASGGSSAAVIKIAVTETKAANNSANGIVAFSIAGHSAVAMVVDRFAAANNNGLGIQEERARRWHLDWQFDHHGNGTGVSAINGAAIGSYKNNSIICERNRRNAVDGGSFELTTMSGVLMNNQGAIGLDRYQQHVRWEVTMFAKVLLAGAGMFVQRLPRFAISFTLFRMPRRSDASLPNSLQPRGRASWSAMGPTRIGTAPKPI